MSVELQSRCDLIRRSTRLQYSGQLTHLFTDESQCFVENRFANGVRPNLDLETVHE